MRLVVLSRPEHVAHVLVAQARRYGKSVSYRELEHALGRGLVTSEGELWRRQRRIVQPMFLRRTLGRFVPTFAAETRRMLEGWASAADGAPPADLDVGREMTALTLAIAGRTLFSADLRGEARAIGDALDVVLPVITHRTEALFNLPLAWPLPAHRRFHAALATTDRLVQGLIDARVRAQAAGPAGRAADGPPADLLAALVAARDPETGAPMPSRQVRDEVVTFLMAGHETTANALAWTFHELGQHPAWADRVAEEAARELGPGDPTPEALARLETTRRVVSEALRLHPPAWTVEREALEDDVVDGWRVPKGSLVMLPQLLVHRHPALWDDPARFDPDRFLPERVAARPRMAYFPFGAGQRQCVGEDFAWLELLAVVALVCRAGRLEPAPAPAPAPEVGITLRARGVLARWRPRALAPSPGACAPAAVSQEVP